MDNMAKISETITEIMGNTGELSTTEEDIIRDWLDLDAEERLEPWHIAGFNSAQSSLKSKYQLQNNKDLRGAKDYFCTQCFDTEEIVKLEDGLYSGKECSCVQKKRILKEKNKKQKRIEKLFDKSQISKQNRGKKFNDFMNLDGKKVARKIAIAYVDKFSQMKERGLGLTFIGNTGVGKTLLVEIMAQQIMQKAFTCLSTTAYDLWLNIAKTYNSNSKVSTKAILKKPKNVDLLILDNFNSVSVRNFGDDEAKKFFNIINYRYNQNLPTIITTTTKLNKLSEQLSKDLIERIKEKNKSINITGVNFREVKGKKADQIIEQIINS